MIATKQKERERKKETKPQPNAVLATASTTGFWIWWLRFVDFAFR